MLLVMCLFIKDDAEQMVIFSLASLLYFSASFKMNSTNYPMKCEVKKNISSFTKATLQL